MKVNCLASSSAGNCFLLELDCGTRTSIVMVECGIPAGKIMDGASRCGVDVSKVEACLITHAHGDHCLAARNIANWGIPVFASQPTLDRCLPKGGRVLEELVPNKVAEGVAVLPFPVDHDIEGAMGFVIKTARETILFVNDCKKWDCDLSGFKFDYAFVECNYWHKMVYAQVASLNRMIASGKLDDNDRRDAQVMLKQHERNINAHMSLAGCIRGLKKLDLSSCRAIFLMHLSDRFANEYEMKMAVSAAFKIRTLACQKRGGIK